MKAVEFGLLAVTALIIMGLAFMRPVVSKAGDTVDSHKGEKPEVL